MRALARLPAHLGTFDRWTGRFTTGSIVGEVITVSDVMSSSTRAALPVEACPYRMVLALAEAVVAVCGAAGAAQLWTGTYAPPVSDLDRLGLSSWVLPGVWLFATVALPSSVAAWLAWRRSPWAPTAVLVACGALAVELVVQIPFIGPSVLQAVFGAVAVGLGAVALRARASGWRRG